MRPSLWFIIPIHGRAALTAICLRQLRRTCEALIGEGINATAVVVGDQQNLEEFRERTGGLGFATVLRDNSFLSGKFNDGIQLALDPRHNPSPADYVIPCGSDDWVDHRALLDLPAPDTVVCFQRTSCVREDGQEIAATHFHALGGTGIRIYPHRLMEPVGYRPADEDRRRGCDTSILVNLVAAHGHRLKIEHRHLHDRQIVDWKTAGEQLNPYQSVVRLRRGRAGPSPFDELEGIYPAESLAAMRDHYAPLWKAVA